jgi:hypothetical protein
MCPVPLAWGPTAPQQAARTKEAAVHHAIAMVETYSADDAHDGLDYFYHEHENERDINQGEDKQNAIGNPRSSTNANGNLRNVFF